MYYKLCNFCVMDTSYPFIKFDSNGQCNCCRDAIARRPFEWWPDSEGDERIEIMKKTIKSQGKDKPYDAMIGLSGGVDSAFLAHLAVKKLGLRLLAVHVDGGWNTEPAVRNIELIVRKLDIDLHTHVIEWEEMRDLQLSFLKASVLNQDIPQDHAFFSTLYRTAKKFNIKHFLSGVNYSSENIVPPSWGHPSMDGMHAKAIHNQFGSITAKKFPFMSTAEFLILTRLFRQLIVHRPLNYINYNKDHARDELTKLYGWRDYGGKHCESRFTKFYQEIYLPKKFSFDKRRLHLSSLIVSGQIARHQAILILNQPITTSDQTRRDTSYVAKKLGISREYLEDLIALPVVEHRTYPNGMKWYSILSIFKNILRQCRIVK